MSKHILLIISGSIAAVKSLELIRLLKNKHYNVTCVLTKSGEQFVTPMALAALSGNKVYSDLFSLNDETEMGHIALSRAADLIVVAPASANIMAKMVAGIADDLATTLLLATNKPVVIAPAMNVKMWEHPATKRNVAQLKKDGIMIVEPAVGTLACGEEGQGRLAELNHILAIIEKEAAPYQPLKKLKALVTSGPTHEALDPVRYLTNRSSGKQGHAVAAALAHLGADVLLISGPTSEPDPIGVTVKKVLSAEDMLKTVMNALPVDVAVCAAAVSDWRADHIEPKKIKKEKSVLDMTFTFMQNPDILENVSKSERRPSLVIGFAAETENLTENARDKRKRKGCDWVVANLVAGGAVFGETENQVTLITEQGEETWPKLTKTQVAEKLVEKIVITLKAGGLTA
jgi:phosphopantothenoylcysteine decarboxylase/phosphopantothenate--cysteine ligase